MVYRGRSGADPEKKGEDVFPWFFGHPEVYAALLGMTKSLGREPVFSETAAQNTFR